MVQRKVGGKLGIQADHVKSDKHLSNLKLSSYSQHQDGKSKGADMKKKTKKARSIKISDLEALQSSSPSRKSLPQQGKPPPLHVPTTAASPSPQKQHSLVRTTDGSPNYMKPTSSSHAKKELFPVSLRNTQSAGSDFKKLARKFSSDSKASCVASKKPPKNLTRSSSLSLVRTLTKTTSFKASRACSRKSTRAALCADLSAPQRATCSSTLKDSKFPAYLMLNPGGTESEGTSVMKVCPYTYCSLNGHCHAALPPLKSFMSARRRLLKTQKSMKLVEALSPRRLKVPGETEKKEDSDFELNVFDGKHAYHEIGMDIFIEIYAKEREAKLTGVGETEKVDFVKDIEDQEDTKCTINGIATREDDLEEDFKKHVDDVEIEADIKGRFFQEQNAEDADVGQQPSWSHEEISMGSYSSDEASYDGEHMEDVEMDGSDSKGADMEWEEEQFCGFDLEEDAGSAVFTEEDTDSKVESLSESSHDLSVTWSWLDDILGCWYEDILAEETPQEANAEESTSFEEQPHGVSSVLEGTSGSTETEETAYPSCGATGDQSSLTEETFEYLTNAEDNGGENEKNAGDEASSNMNVLDEETIGNNQSLKMCETCKNDENSDESNSEVNQIHLSVAQYESYIEVQDQEMMETDQGKAAKKFQSTSYRDGEEKDTSKKWSAIRRKRPVEEDDEIRKFNPREPNFLPLVPEPEPEKVDLRHQMMDERKNAEEWMLDCALRQAVTKLAPARKKKVALLVEAFETVMPTRKCETQMRNNSGFAHARRIQPCS